MTCCRETYAWQEPCLSQWHCSGLMRMGDPIVFRDLSS